MGHLEDIALKRAMQGFRQTYPGVPYDRYNREHVAFIERRIRDHLHIMKQNINARGLNNGFK